MLRSNMNIDILCKTFLEKFESLLDIYGPLKEISKTKLKFKDKPWITSGLQKSIPIKNCNLSKVIRLKTLIKKRKPK